MNKIIYAFTLTVILCFTVGCSKDRIKQAQEVSVEKVALSRENVDKFISGEVQWDFDVTDPAKIFADSDYFIKIRVNQKEETKYFIKNTIQPDSTYDVEVLKVISPEDILLPKNIKIALGGGIVSMKEYMDTLDLETKEKVNANQLSKEDLEKKVLIFDDSYYEFEVGKEYCIFIRDLTKDKDYEGYYGLPSGGYDIFVEEDGKYINVLTNKDFQNSLIVK